MRLDGKFIKDESIKPEKFDTNGYAPSAAGDLITLDYFQSNVDAPVTAANGVVRVGDEIQLGGDLTTNTAITDSTNQGFSITQANGNVFDMGNWGGFSIASSTLFIVDVTLATPAIGMEFTGRTTSDANYTNYLAIASPGFGQTVRAGIGVTAGIAGGTVWDNVQEAFTVARSSYTTPQPGVAAGIGVAIGFQVLAATTVPPAAQIKYRLTDVTNLTEDGKFTFAVNVNRTVTEVLDITKDGAVYIADYSANFTARSLVDKAYVDSVAGGGGWPLTGTATLTGGVVIEGDNNSLSLGSDTSYLSNVDVYSGNDINLFNALGGGFQLTGISLSLSYNNVYTLVFNNTGMQVTLDTGLQFAYAADYSADYTNRSLVDKEYVDNAIAGGGSSYTFENGLTEAAGVIKLGGTLTGNTDISGAFEFSIGNTTLPTSLSMQGEYVYFGTSNSFTELQNNAGEGSVTITAQNGAQASVITLNPAISSFTANEEITISAGGHSLVLSSNSTGMEVLLAPGGFGFNFNGNDPGSAFDVGVGSIGIRFFAESTTDTGGAFAMTSEKTSTNTLGDVARFTRATSGTAANGISGRIQFGIENVDGTFRYAEWQHILTNAANGAEDSTLLFRGYRNGGLTDFLRMEGDNGGLLLTTYYGVAQYNADYSASFTARSLVDKAYVDSIVYPTPVVQNISGAVSIDLSTGNVFILTLTANVTSFTFTNEVLGREYTFYFLQSTTYKTLTFTAGKFRFPFGTAPSLSDPTANSPTDAIDVMTMKCGVAGRLDVVMSPNFINN